MNRFFGPQSNTDDMTLLDLTNVEAWNPIFVKFNHILNTHSQVLFDKDEDLKQFYQGNKFKDIPGSQCSLKAKIRNLDPNQNNWY